VNIDWENQGRLWARPAAIAVVTAGIAYVLSVFLGAIAGALAHSSDNSVGDYLRLGGYVLLLAQHVSLDETFHFGEFGSGHFASTFMPLGLTAVILTLLFLAGRRSVPSDTRSRWQAVWTGLRFGSVYAVVCLVICFATRTSSSTTSVGPSPVQSFFLPLLWAFLATTAGAYKTIGGALSTDVIGRTARWVPQLRAGIRGAREGLIASLPLEVLALAITILVASLKNPSAASDFFTSPRDVLALIFVLIVCLPNWLALGMVGAMGATLQAKVSASSAYGIVSVGIFGASGQVQGLGSTSVHVPAYWLFALIIPAAVTLFAGYSAAAASGGDARDQTIAGALAGLLITIVIWITVALSAVTVGGEADVDFALSLKASAAGLIFLPLLWGVVGGAIGAQVLVTRRGPRGSTVPFTQSEPARPETFSPPGLWSPHAGEHPGLDQQQPSPAQARPPSFGQEPGPGSYDPESTTIRPARPDDGGRPQSIPSASSAPGVFCTVCGARNSARHRFCQQCGRPLAGSDPY
jgi:hypothetical protein